MGTQRILPGPGPGQQALQGAQDFFGRHLLLGFLTLPPPAGSVSDHIHLLASLPWLPCPPPAPQHGSHPSPGGAETPRGQGWPPQSQDSVSLSLVLPLMKLSSGPETQLHTCSLKCAAAGDPETQSLANAQTQQPACKAGSVCPELSERPKQNPAEQNAQRCSIKHFRAGEQQVCWKGSMGTGYR